MQKTIIILTSLILSSIATAQVTDCNYTTFNMEENVVKQFRPIPVGNSATYQMAFAVTNLNGANYVMLTIRFINSASDVVNNDLLLFTAENNVASLKLLDTTKDFVGGSEISIAKFELNSQNYELLRKENIINIRFALQNDDLQKTYKVKINSDVLIKQLKCLN
jgi:hypothetical protein